MGYLVRMLERQKWEEVQLDYVEQTPADAITSELRTRANTLSLWLIDGISDIHNAIITLATGRNKITRLDVILIEESEINNSELMYENSPQSGDSIIDKFNEYHYDLVDMNYEKLGYFCKIIIRNLNDPMKCIRYDKAQVSDILYDGFVKGMFQLDDLNEKLKKDFEKVIARKSKSKESQTNPTHQ